MTMTMTKPLLGALPESTVRPVTMDDVPIITELMRRVSMDAIGEPNASEGEVHDELIGPRFDISRDTALIVDREGRAAAYAQAHDEHDERAFIDVFVDPELSDQLFAEVAGRALEGAKSRIREALIERHGLSTTVAAGLYHGELRMLAAYEAAGMQRERVYWRMRVDLQKRTFTPSELTEGVTISLVDPDDDDVMVQALSLNNDTFSDHHGHVDMKFDEYAEFWRAAGKYDRNAWWFAYLGGVPVGLCLGDEGKVDEDAGYIGVLGVASSARGRGIARALLLTAFAEYQRRGRGAVQLGVDSSNETGATRLYESVGMRPMFAIDSLAMNIAVLAKP